MKVHMFESNYLVKWFYSEKGFKQTTCKIIGSDNMVIGEGVARTYKEDKNKFNKNIGRKLSMKKALVNMNRNVRTIVWKEYHSMTGRKIVVNKSNLLRVELANQKEFREGNL